MDEREPLGQLKPNDMELLRKLIAKRDPALLPLLDQIGNVRLTFDQRESLRDKVLDEFTELGLRENDEPNQYGLQLDDLIAYLGHV